MKQRVGMQASQTLPAVEVVRYGQIVSRADIGVCDVNLRGIQSQLQFSFRGDTGIDVRVGGDTFGEPEFHYFCSVRDENPDSLFTNAPQYPRFIMFSYHPSVGMSQFAAELKARVAPIAVRVRNIMSGSTYNQLDCRAPFALAIKEKLAFYLPKSYVVVTDDGRDPDFGVKILPYIIRHQEVEAEVLIMDHFGLRENSYVPIMIGKQRSFVDKEEPDRPMFNPAWMVPPVDDAPWMVTTRTPRPPSPATFGDCRKRAIQCAEEWPNLEQLFAIGGEK